MNTLNENILKEITDDIYTIEVNTLKANVEGKITNKEMEQTIKNLNELAHQIDNIYNKAEISNQFNKKDIEKYIFYLNKEVLVKVDRKLGDKHPNFDFIYPVNYGYIPNTLSEDNEEIDAYILGILYPVDEFKGICKAVICRYDNNENKLIVVPKDKNYTIEQMEALVEFQERFFKHKIIIE